MEHIIPKPVYYRIAILLMVLLVLTVAIAYIDLGPFNLVVAMLIAVIKAVLVVLFFMHVKYGPRVIWIVSVAGFFWLFILFVLTLGDFMTRSEPLTKFLTTVK